MRRKLTVLLVFSIIVAMATPLTVKAETVGGNHALGGLSLYMERFFNSGRRLYEEEDLDLLSEVIFHENYDNGDYIMRLTGSVVLNRVAHKDFPNSIRDVLYQKGQYSTVPMFFTKAIPNSVRQIARELLIFGSIAPPDIIWQAMFPQGKGVWYEYNHEYFCY